MTVFPSTQMPGMADGPGFTGGTLDRADRLRHDAEALAAARADPRARLLLLDRLAPEMEMGALRWRPLADAPPGADIVLLGIGERGIPHFAAAGHSGPAGDPPINVMALAATLGREDAATYAAARSLVDWHRRHGFCARCGTRTEAFRAGWARRCDQCGAEHFPRTDPVVIMIAEHDGRALLGRQPTWPPGRFSALAGFLEPGESIEEAVARETLEETGVRVRDVRYVASQPWPFPSSLMIACIATADDDRLEIDRNELEHALWVPRADVRAALAGRPDAPFAAPPPIAIAHTLLSAWVAQE